MRTRNTPSPTSVRRSEACGANRSASCSSGTAARCGSTSGATSPRSAPPSPNVAGRMPWRAPGGPCWGGEIDDADEFSAWLASERSALVADWRSSCRAAVREATHRRRTPGRGASRGGSATAGRPARRTGDALAARGPARRRGRACRGGRRALRAAWLAGRPRAHAPRARRHRQDDARRRRPRRSAWRAPGRYLRGAARASGGTRRGGRRCLARRWPTLGPPAGRAATADARPRRPRALLLLDGFGTHLDQVRTVDALVRATAGATVLVTSRMRLGLATEMVGEVGPRGRAPTRGPGARRSAPGRRAIRFGLTRGPPGPVAPPFHARFTLASLPAP